MKKITKQNKTHSNKRGFASAIVCFALLLLGATAFAQPANDDFANAIQVSGTSFSQSGTTVGATRQSGDPDTVKYEGGSPARTPTGSRSVWHRWTAPAGGTYTLTALATGGSAPGTDTQLGVYTGVHGSLIEIESAEDSFESGNNNSLGGGQSRLRFNATSGAVYSFMVNGFDSVEVNYNLVLSSSGTTNPPPSGLTLSVTTTGSGNVTRNPSKTTYDTNEVVELTAVPTGTNTFLGWGGDAAAFGSTNPISITMDGNKNVSASFTTGGAPGTNTYTLAVVRLPSNSAGSVTRIPNKSRYNEGEVVTVIARPSGSRTFEGWSNTDESNNDRTNHVTMTSDKTITATFSGTDPNPEPNPNVFSAIVGTYNGLFSDSSVSANCSGYFTAKVSKTGKISVKLKRGGKTLSGSGQLGTNGNGSATIGKAPRSATVEVQIDITGVNPAITGTFTSEECNAALEGDRVVYNSKNPSPIQGTYTFILPRNTATVTQTNEVVETNGIIITTNQVVTTNESINPGHSFASLVISKTGSARIRGALADGTKFSQSTTISANGEIPFFASLYRGAGLLIGWLNVTQTEVSGNPVVWKRPAGGLLFPAGIDADIAVFGSKFDRTASPLINLGANIIVELGANDQFSTNDSRVIPVVFSSASQNVLVERDATESRLQINLLTSGLVRGKFTSLVTGKSTVMQGALIQNNNAAYGFFINTAGSRGFFEIRNDTMVETTNP